MLEYHWEYPKIITKYSCWSRRSAEDIYVAKFNLNLHNTPNQEARLYTFYIYTTANSNW